MKIRGILATISLTVAAMSVAFTIFMNSILGVFGLAATSIETLQNLKASQSVVKKMKKRHKAKKVRVTKRFVKRSSKRALAGASAAVVPGAGVLAVAAVMVGIEGADYCDERKALQEDEDILFNTKTDFDLDQCIEEAQADAEVIMADVKESSSEAVSSVYDGIAGYSADKWESLKSFGSESTQSLGETASRIWNSADKAVSDVE